MTIRPQYDNNITLCNSYCSCCCFFENSVRYCRISPIQIQYEHEMTGLEYREKCFLTTQFVMESVGNKADVIFNFSRTSCQLTATSHFFLFKIGVPLISKNELSIFSVCTTAKKRHALLEQKVGQCFGFDMTSFQKPATISDIFFCNFRFKDIHIVWLCFNWLAMSNTCYNPFIYGLLNVSSFYDYC